MEETRFLHEGPLTVSIVDIGSNSVRMNIYAIDEMTGSFSVISSSRAMLRLAAHVEDGKLDADGEGKLFALLREYLARSNSMPCDVFTAFATASLRGISNSDEVIARLYDKLGVKISVISGESEAQYDYIATIEHFKDTLAPRAIAALVESGKHLYKPHADGTKSGLIEFMDRSGIDISVVMPVVTKQSQTIKTNAFSAEITDDRIKAFGGIYPHW